MRFQDTAHPFTLSSPKVDPLKIISQPERQLTHELLVETAACMKERAAIGRRSSYAGTRNKAEAIVLEANRIPDCGWRWKLHECAGCKTKYRSRVSCNSRLCPHCSLRFARKYKAALAQALIPLFAKKERGKALMFVTLSVTSTRFGDQLPDRAGFDRFYRESAAFFRLHYGKWECKQSRTGKPVEDASKYSYKIDAHGKRIRLERRQPIVKISATGKRIEEWRRWKGAGSVITAELGNNSGRPGYLNNNLHAHALVYGSYIPGRQLIESWKRITGDSNHCVIKTVKGLKHAVNYVLKYITKPPAIDNPDGLAEWAEMLKGIRRLRSSGIFVGAIKREKAERHKHCCPRCGGFLCECGEEVITDLDHHPALSLWREQQLAVQLPPPENVSTRTNTDRLIDQKESAWRSDIDLGLKKELAKWQIAVTMARREHGAGPVFVRSGIFARWVQHHEQYPFVQYAEPPATE